MTEERQQMHQEILVGMRKSNVECVNILLEILIFVFLHDRTQPMTIVVKENPYDCQTPKGIAFVAR
jgi:hypothetical protein